MSTIPESGFPGGFFLLKGNVYLFVLIYCAKCLLRGHYCVYVLESLRKMGSTLR